TQDVRLGSWSRKLSDTWLLPQSRLRRRQPGDWHSERRAAHVIQPDLVAEFDAVGVAAVFAADADFEVGVRRAASFDTQFHQAADAVEVDGLKRVARHKVVFQVDADEAAVVVAAHAKSSLRKVVRAKAEELGFLGDLICGHASTR